MQLEDEFEVGKAAGCHVSATPTGVDVESEIAEVVSDEGRIGKLGFVELRHVRARCHAVGPTSRSSQQNYSPVSAARHPMPSGPGRTAKH